MLPVPGALAAGSGGGSDSGGGGTSVSNTYVTVNGGQNSLGHANSVDVSTSITNITADNVTVYVEGDYNPTYLYYPKVSELHMVNNTNGALWNPMIKELPKTLHASVMKGAGVAILYDGWIDLENVGTTKPEGATRAGEILGYDIYAKLGEKYIPTSETSSYDQAGNPIKVPVGYTYENGGIYSKSDPVNYTWAITHLYRAVGVEQVEFYVLTEGRKPLGDGKPGPGTYDINSSPLAQFITMSTKGVDLSAVIANVHATRTNPDTYLEIAEKDCIGVVPSADREKQRLTVGEFCLLAYKLMDLYGEPVLTDKETYLLLEAYGQKLPYGIPEAQLEAVKYLLARGIIDSDMSWRDDITFEDASTILMRIKDKDSRLTFKEIQLTTDVGLLAKGYYPTTVSTYSSPIELTDQFTGYDSYASYDYFVEAVDDIRFKSVSGNYTLPFIGAGYDNVDGVLAGTSYVGRVTINEREFYHFRADMPLDTIGVNGSVYINTAKGNDAPARYTLPLPGSGNEGGYYTYEGGKVDATSTTVVSEWTWHPLDDSAVQFPSEYLDKARHEKNAGQYNTQLGLFNESSYGFSFRVYSSDLGKVSFKNAAGESKTLKDVTNQTEDLGNNISLRRTYKDSSAYNTFEVRGCSNKNTLSELFHCDGGAAYQAYPAFARQNNQYLVSVDYLKSIGAVWEFTKTSDTTYYLGVKSVSGTRKDDPIYTDVFIGTTVDNSYVIRGSQLTVYTSDTAVVVEADTGYYVDYSAVMGISDLVGFDDNEGSKTLTTGAELEGVQRRYIKNTNNSFIGSGTKDVGEWAATVNVKSGNTIVPYVYCPVTYPLANWVTVDNHLDGQQGIFTFFAKDPNDDTNQGKSDGAVKLTSMLGAEPAKEWDVSFTSIPPISSVEATYDSATDTYSVAGGGLPDVAYIPKYDAFIIKPNLMGSDTFSNYGGFVAKDKSSFLTSLVYSGGSSGYFGDWNYNWYLFSGSDKYSAVNVRHQLQNKTSWYCDLSSFSGGSFESHPNDSPKYYVKWVPAPVGIPGLLGYPESLSATLHMKSNVNTYSGITFASRNTEGGQVYGSGDSTFSQEELKYSLIHATPTAVWIQSCGFAFTFMAGSKLGATPPTAPGLVHGDASAGFDWEQFFKDVGIQNADDWLTIAIIAVLNILPRIFMFAFVILMGLALIANVKPWQIFCDNVFDPYKLLTLGRKDVHTIQLKMVLLYSIIALSLFGLFQNGLILNVIAWFARAVTGILSR